MKHESIISRLLDKIRPCHICPTCHVGKLVRVFKVSKGVSRVECTCCGEGYVLLSASKHGKFYIRK